jgi:glycosyltransferase involved in cell wall biosynthesis
VSRVLIHSNAPWVPTGYGKQCRHLIRILGELGHEVAVSAFSGLSGAPVPFAQGVPVFPSGMYGWGVDMLPGHIRTWEADLTIALMDFYKLGPIAAQLKDVNLAAWLPVDCAPLSGLDRQALKESGAHPVAMAQFGHEELSEAGFAPLYAPHVVDTDVFRPLTAEQRTLYRENMGIADRFVIGICAANNDGIRKAFPEQLSAFARFQKRRPEAFLMLHTVAESTNGVNIPRLIHELGIPTDAVKVTDTYTQLSGLFDDSLMADWYGVLDVLSACSYAEAFGVPMLEAQACGTPVVSTRGSAMEEMNPAGWLVTGERFWNHVHGAWWMRPVEDNIVRAYEKAYKYAPNQRADAVEFARTLDIAAGVAKWGPIVDKLCG